MFLYIYIWPTKLHFFFDKNEIYGDFVDRGIDWDVITSMTEMKDINCLSHNAMMNNIMLDEDDNNEELINNMLEEEDDIWHQWQFNPAAQSRMP